MTSRSDTLHDLLFEGLTAEAPSTIAEVPPHRRVLTPAERKAAETTRVAREATEAEAEQRQAQVARLRRARLEREAVDKAAAAAAPPKKTRKRA
jgi:hypothetical protein